MDGHDTMGTMNFRALIDAKDGLELTGSNGHGHVESLL
jgi:hypothetical protein